MKNFCKDLKEHAANIISYEKKKKKKKTTSGTINN